MQPTRRLLAPLALAALAVRPAAAQTSPELLAALRAGGLVLYWRHPATHADQADAAPIDFAACDRQRNLNDAGRAQSRELGAVLRERGVPITRIVSSPFCRAREAAELTGLGPVTLDADIAEGGLIVSPSENSRRARALRTLLGTAPASGNTLLVGHRPNLLDAAGAEAFTIAEGEIFVFQPQAASPGFRLLGRVPMAGWRG